MTKRRDIPAWTWVVATALVIGLFVFGALAWRAVTTEHADPVDAQNRFAAALAAASSKTPLIKRDSSGHWARPQGTLSRGSQPTHLEVLAYRASEERIIKADVPLWFLKIKGPAVNYALDGTGFDLATSGLTASDLERAGAGVVVDETRTNGDRVLAWTYSRVPLRSAELQLLARCSLRWPPLSSWGVVNPPGIAIALVVLVTAVGGARIADAQSQPAAPAPTTAPASPQVPTPPPVFKVDVVESTPLPGSDLTIDQVAAPVQTALARDVEASGALDLSDFLNRRFNGVFVNEMQNNPLQPDLNYRGYTASPLLGTPQGLSVYMDGVRLNQPFGDVVSWDLIPRIAIASATLMPGSNPLFGLNTLGGALAIETKDGRSNPGTSLRAIYGSDLRRTVEFEHGGNRASGLNWYIAGNYFAEDCWRDDSPSQVGQVFGKVGWHRSNSSTALSVGYADTNLTGNGLQELRFLDRDFASVYTKPDQTDNRSTLINLTTRRDVRPSLTVSGNVYYRHIRTKTFNGDINDDSLDQSVYQPTDEEQQALAEAGYTGVPTSGEDASNTPFPSWRCIANVLLEDEPGETCNGLLNRSHTTQHNYGVSAQATWRDWLRPGNALTAGAGYDGSRSSFDQSTQLGYLNPDRSITGLDAFADGVTGGNVDGEPYDNRVDLGGRTHTGSVFASDVLSVHNAWNITLSARYNRTSIDNIDRLNPGGGAGSLDGSHVYSRLNPATGVTFSPTPTVNLYAGYGEGSRAPTSIELGCADPAEPCKLPNALAGDPPLRQVVTRTVEAGIRGTRQALSWNAGVFHADNADDILFVASELTGFGYFRNFGRTRRAGVEAGLSATKGRLSGAIGYTWLNATFQSTETIDGTGNSTNDAAIAGQPGLEGTISIEPGNHIPLVPRHMLKVHGDVVVTPKLSVDMDLVAASGSYARGNENNRSQADGTYYLGPGATSAYAIVNLGVRYDLTKWLQAIAQVNNVFDARYFTAAQLQATGFTAAGNFVAQPFPAIGSEYPVQQATFYAPGAPATFWIGTRITF